MPNFVLGGSGWRAKNIPIILFLLALPLSLYFLRLPDPNFILLAILWLAVSILNFCFCRTSGAKLLWLNFGFLCLFAGATELYLKSLGYGSFGRPPARHEGNKTALTKPHEILGYTLPAEIRATDRAYSGDELMWDVTYTMDRRGLRVTPEPQRRDRCILFFGGSFVFGEGIDDEATLPYQVGEMMAPDVKAYNFGMTGYGAHQMLAALELGLVDETLDCDRNAVSDVVYQSLSMHLLRAAGVAPWDDHGPRYELDEKGEAIYRGHFDDGYRKLLRPLLKRAHKSAIYQRAFGKWQYFRRPKPADSDRFIAIVWQAREIVRDRYPCAAFHILFWDTDWHLNEEVIARFEARGLKVHRVSTILPDYGATETGDIYNVHPDDDHPNGLANAGVADFFVKSVFSEESPCDKPVLSD